MWLRREWSVMGPARFEDDERESLRERIWLEETCERRRLGDSVRRTRLRAGRLSLLRGSAADASSDSPTLFNALPQF